MKAMTEYKANSIIEFHDGIENCKNIVLSWNNIEDENWKDQVRKNYNIDLIIKALEFKNESVH